MINPKPSALFSLFQESIESFSWSAASLATIAGLSSYGTPAFGHHNIYEYKLYDYLDEHPLAGQTIPHCTKTQMIKAKNNDNNRPAASSSSWE